MNVEGIGCLSSTTWGSNNGGQSISKMLSEMVNQMDVDKNGGLTIDEMGIEEELFSSIDTDADGLVTAEELQADLESRMAELGLKNGQMGSAEFSHRVSQLINEMDTDSDGALNLTEMGIDEEIFNSIDTDGDGLVTAEELQADMEKMMAAGGSPPTPPQEDLSELVSSIMDENDEDGDGALSQSEMGGGQQVFDSLDTNEDGVVSAEELQAGLEKMMAAGGPPPQEDTAKMAASIIGENDEDGDGALSQSEMGGGQQVFDSLDTNEDGVVSAEELQAGLKKMMAQGQEQQTSTAQSTSGYNTYSNTMAASFSDQSGLSGNDLFNTAKYSQEYNAGMYRKLDRMV